ncbi:hypothetical protein KUCAC02_005920, partial [Chaenocephalus aceratus]
STQDSERLSISACSFGSNTHSQAEQYSTLKKASCHQVERLLLYIAPKDVPP